VKQKKKYEKNGNKIKFAFYSIFRASVAVSSPSPSTAPVSSCLRWPRSALSLAIRIVLVIYEFVKCAHSAPLGSPAEHRPGQDRTLLHLHLLSSCLLLPAQNWKSASPTLHSPCSTHHWTFRTLTCQTICSSSFVFQMDSVNMSLTITLNIYRILIRREHRFSILLLYVSSNIYVF